MTNNKNLKFFSTISLFQNYVTKSLFYNTVIKYLFINTIIKGLIINNFLFLFYFIILIFIFSLYLSNNIVYCMKINSDYDCISFKTISSSSIIYDSNTKFSYNTINYLPTNENFASLANYDAIYDANIFKGVPSNFRDKLLTLVNTITATIFSTTSLTTELPSTIKDSFSIICENYAGIYIEGVIDYL